MPIPDTARDDVSGKTAAQHIADVMTPQTRQLADVEMHHARWPEGRVVGDG